MRSRRAARAWRDANGSRRGLRRIPRTRRAADAYAILERGENVGKAVLKVC